MQEDRGILSAVLRKYLRYAAVAPGLLLAGSPATAEKPPNEVFAVTTAITLPSVGGVAQKVTSFDIGFVDPVIGEYFLAARTNKAVDVVDTGTNTLVTQLKATPPFAGATGNLNIQGTQFSLTSSVLKGKLRGTIILTS